MLDSQIPFFELHQSLLDYSGDDVYRDLLEGWLNDNAEQRDWLAEFQRRTDHQWDAASPDDLAKLYAIFRVTSILLLGFQSPLVESNYAGPAISLDGFGGFHERLGFEICSKTEYHPFFHEILSVRQSPNAADPVNIDDCAWPPLMLGNLMFCRAGCSVTAGSQRALESVADRSTLYWTYRRNDRRCRDLSHGWGHNSEWRTSLRRDYLSEQQFHYNVDGKISLNDPSPDTDDLPISTCIELVRHRCLVTSNMDDSDLWPYDYTYTEDA